MTCSCSKVYVTSLVEKLPGEREREKILFSERENDMKVYVHQSSLVWWRSFLERQREDTLQ